MLLLPLLLRLCRTSPILAMSSSSAIDSASLDGPASPSLASARTITNDSEHEHTTAFTPGYDTEQVKEVFQVTSSPDSLPPLAVSWRLEDEKTRRNEVSFWTGSLCGSLISLICMCIGKSFEACYHLRFAYTHRLTTSVHRSRFDNRRSAQGPS